MELLSKSDFAAHINVSAGRVSQMLTAGIIGQDCLVGEGRSAKIDVAKAVRQIGLRRDIGQSLGNGIGTQLTLPDEPTAPKPNKTDDLAQQLQQERLESERRKNRIAASEELVRQGQLVPADQVRASMTKLARQVDDENGAMLADFASEIASKFGLVQRDVLHLLRQVRNEKKAAAAERAKARAAELPATVEIVVSEAVEA
jgi:hypothetical protein